MRTANFYRWKPEISMRAYCDRYAVSNQNNILYLLSISGPDSAVRGIIAAIQTGESISIRGDGEAINCRKGISPLRSFTTKLQYENLTHGVCVDTSLWEMNKEILILKNDPETVYHILHKYFSITAIPEWKNWIHKKLQEYIAPLRCYGMEAFLLTITEEEIDTIISAGCRTGELKFTKNCVSGNYVSGSHSVAQTVNGVESYLQKFGSELAKKVHANFRPLYLPEKQKWNGRIHALRRKPFQAQGDAIMGAVETLKKERALNIVGEMGVGKSLIGAAIPYVCSEKPCRTLIVCPGHLVRKWADEIKTTVPNSETYILRKYTDLMPLLELRNMKPKCYEYMIISRDKSKLSFFWRPAVIKKGDGFACPDCGTIFKDKEGWDLPISYFSQSKRYCENCHTPLWEADNTRIRRFAPAEFIKKYLKNFFTFAEFDEVHELKGSDTAQGNVFGMLASCIEKVITLTGTFSSGYSDDVFYLIYRTLPRKMREEGFLWTDSQKWLQNFGILERVTKTSREGQDNSASRGSKKRENVRRRPGVSPLVYSKFLLGNTVFLQLDDISDNLPMLTENVVGVRMSPELEKAYNKIEMCIGERVRREMTATGNSCLLGTYLMSLLAYPDVPFNFGPILHPSAKKELPEEYFKEKFLIENPGIIDPRDVLVIPDELPEDIIYPKEKLLLEIVEEEIKNHRRCIIFACFTGVRDVTGRIESLLQKKNFRVATLKSSVPPETRISWVSEKVKQGYQVLLSNPELVKTGADLLDFPTIIYFSTGYNSFTLRQSSRRSWRIGQTKDVKVYYLYYQSSMQEQCLKLMGAKLAAAVGLDGRFSEEGLIAMGSGDDLMSALAKSIVEKIENTDSAESIWKRMAKKTERPETVPKAPAKVALAPAKITLPDTINIDPLTPARTIFIEITKLKGKRRIVERVEGSEEEIRKVMQKENTVAQLTFF